MNDIAAVWPEVFEPALARLPAKSLRTTKYFLHCRRFFIFCKSVCSTLHLDKAFDMP
jgi:hypothetical protein